MQHIYIAENDFRRLNDMMLQGGKPGAMTSLISNHWSRNWLVPQLCHPTRFPGMSLRCIPRYACKIWIRMKV